MKAKAKLVYSLLALSFVLMLGLMSACGGTPEVITQVVTQVVKETQIVEIEGETVDAMAAPVVVVCVDRSDVEGEQGGEEHGDVGIDCTTVGWLDAGAPAGEAGAGKGGEERDHGEDVARLLPPGVEAREAHEVLEVQVEPGDDD